jgi:SAM-dependent methyltransferase
MIDYSKRSEQKELLDQPGIPFADIAMNMKELEFINKYLGGHAITINGFKKLLQKRKTISVSEIGCGGGDNLNEIIRFCKKKDIIASFAGIDINKECISYAQENIISRNVVFYDTDYRKVDFKNNPPDIIFSSLFCHHFTDNELVDMLLWMNQNCSVGFFINDLHRHPLAYHFIKRSTQLFSKSYLVKNDAPVSVLRGFRKNEWKAIFKKAGINNYTIEWKWAFRYLIVVSKS